MFVWALVVDWPLDDGRPVEDMVPLISSWSTAGGLRANRRVKCCTQRNE